jgi:hypothetical protein
MKKELESIYLRDIKKRKNKQENGEISVDM